MITTAGGWSAATASVRGASHERNGKPNQDAVRVVQVDGPTPGLVAAVCDGHGGDRYIRSDVGSRLGAEVACEVGRATLTELGPTPDPMAVEQTLAGTVAAAIVERWRKRVLDHVGRHPFTEEDRASAGAPLDGDPFISYGCTLVLAVVAPSWVGLLQIGDGDVTIVRDSTADSPVPGDDRLVGGETTSLCLPTAVSDARYAVLGEPLPETLILTSDGYANSFASPTWRSDAGIDLRDQIRAAGMDHVEQRLAAWLADSAVAGGDDVSMALIHRSGPARPVTTGAVTADRTALASATEMASAQAGTPGPPRTARRWGAAAMLFLVGLVALGVGGAGGWALAESNKDAVVPPTTASTTSSTAASTTSSVPPELGTDEAVLLIGPEQAFVVLFDPNMEPPLRARSLGEMTAVNRQNQLPAGWDLEDNELVWDDGNRSPTTYPALAVGTSGPFLLAMDLFQLTAYDVTSGRRIGTVELVDIESDQSVPPGDIGSGSGDTSSGQTDQGD